MKATATITEAQLRRIVLDQAAGVTATETAAALGLTHRKVCRVRGVGYKASLVMRGQLGLPQPRRPARRPTRWQDYW